MFINALKKVGNFLLFILTFLLYWMLIALTCFEIQGLSYLAKSFSFFLKLPLTGSIQFFLIITIILFIIVRHILTQIKIEKIMFKVIVNSYIIINSIFFLLFLVFWLFHWRFTFYFDFYYHFLNIITLIFVIYLAFTLYHFIQYKITKKNDNFFSLMLVINILIITLLIFTFLFYPILHHLIRDRSPLFLLEKIKWFFLITFLLILVEIILYIKREILKNKKTVLLFTFFLSSGIFVFFLYYLTVIIGSFSYHYYKVESLLFFTSIRVFITLWILMIIYTVFQYVKKTKKKLIIKKERRLILKKNNLYIILLILSFIFFFIIQHIRHNRIEDQLLILRKDYMIIIHKYSRDRVIHSYFEIELKEVYIIRYHNRKPAYFFKIKSLKKRIKEKKEDLKQFDNKIQTYLAVRKRVDKIFSKKRFFFQHQEDSKKNKEFKDIYRRIVPLREDIYNQRKSDPFRFNEIINELEEKIKKYSKEMEEYEKYSVFIDNQFKEFSKRYFLLEDKNKDLILSEKKLYKLSNDIISDILIYRMNKNEFSEELKDKINKNISKNTQDLKIQINKFKTSKRKSDKNYIDNERCNDLRILVQEKFKYYKIDQNLIEIKLKAFDMDCYYLTKIVEKDLKSFKIIPPVPEFDGIIEKTVPEELIPKGKDKIEIVIQFLHKPDDYKYAIKYKKKIIKSSSSEILDMMALDLVDRYNFIGPFDDEGNELEFHIQMPVIFVSEKREYKWSKYSEYYESFLRIHLDEKYIPDSIKILTNILCLKASNESYPNKSYVVHLVNSTGSEFLDKQIKSFAKILFLDKSLRYLRKYYLIISGKKGYGDKVEYITTDKHNNRVIYTTSINNKDKFEKIVEYNIYEKRYFNLFNIYQLYFIVLIILLGSLIIRNLIKKGKE